MVNLAVNNQNVNYKRTGSVNGKTVTGSLLACDRPTVSQSNYGKLADTYADWLKTYDDMWSWYAHFTFRHGNTKHGSIHPEKADKLFNYFRDKLNSEIWGRNYKKKNDRGVLIARSTEIGDKGGLLHYHTLIGRVPDHIQRVEWKEVWNGLAGFARIYEYDRKQGGASYLSKSAYAWKRGEIDFIGPWSHAKEIMNESYSELEIFANRATQ